MNDQGSRTTEPEAPGTPRRPPAFDVATLIERAIVLSLFGGLMVAVVLILLPLATAILFAAVLAIATWPLRSMLARTGMPRGMVGLVLSLAALVLVGLPVVASAPRLAARIAEGTAAVKAVLLTLPETPPAWIAALPLIGERLARAWQQVASAEGDVEVLVAPYTDWLSEAAIAAASALAASAVQFLLALVVAGLFWANGDRLGAGLRDVVWRLGGETAARALDAAGEALRSVAYGVVGTAVIQGVLMAVGALIAGVPAPGLLGFPVLLLSISQVGAVLLPAVWGGAAWWLFHVGEPVWGGFMIVWGLVLVTMSDTILRLLLISRGVAMPLTLVIVGVLGGFLASDFLGCSSAPRRSPSPSRCCRHARSRVDCPCCDGEALERVHALDDRHAGCERVAVERLAEVACPLDAARGLGLRLCCRD